MPDDGQRHAELAQEHERKAEWHKGLSQGASVDTSNTGSQIGGFFGAIAEHRWLVIGAIAAVIVFIIAMRGFQNQGTSTANQSPDLSQGGYVPSNISTALDSINAAISGLSQQFSNQNSASNTTPPGNTSGSGSQPITGLCPAWGCGPPPIIPIRASSSNNPPVSLPVVHLQQPEPRYVTVTPWPTALSTLWGISQSQGISLQRIENLNPQIPNPDLIYSGQRVRVS